MKEKYVDNVILILLPRTVNKLTLCIHNLSGQSKFNKNTGDLINNFLSFLPPTKGRDGECRDTVKI